MIWLQLLIDRDDRVSIPKMRIGRWQEAYKDSYTNLKNQWWQ